LLERAAPITKHVPDGTPRKANILMIITTRTPLRISLFGGGTDYPVYFRRERGAVLGFTINRYIYISAMPFQCFVDYRFRVSYSRVEITDSPNDISHPVVRAVMQRYAYDSPTDFSIQADLPASSGLGSSSAFTVGFINLISHLQGISRSRMELARDAIFTEQELLSENVGVQDQLHASFGGVNRFNLQGDNISIVPINITTADARELCDWFVLVHTDIKRHASEVVAEQLANTVKRDIDSELSQMLSLVDEGQKVMEQPKPSRVPELARLLHEAWTIKQRCSSKIAGDAITELYDFCLANGALGGKLCGAGGGGFLLLVIPPERQEALMALVGARRFIRFQIDMEGSRVNRQ
jgi:D-glycero-alpha-D-manno-heptose-7-phosphate kinase